MIHSLVVFLVSGFICVGDLETDLVVLVKTVTLEGVHRNSRLQIIFKVNKTQQILPPSGGRLPNQPNLLETGIRPKNILNK